jgi:hypothetical protein
MINNPNAILVDTINFEIVKAIHCDFKPIDGMYYKTDKDLIPISMVYPIEKTEEITALLKELKEAKKAYDEVVTRIFYREFPKLRNKS